MANTTYRLDVSKAGLFPFSPNKVPWSVNSIQIDNHSNQYIFDGVNLTFGPPGITGILYPTEGLGQLSFTLMAPAGVTQASPASGEIDITIYDFQQAGTSGVLSTLAITPTGPATGDLGGNYPGPEVVGILNNPLPALSVGSLTWNGTAWVFSGGQIRLDSGQATLGAGANAYMGSGSSTTEANVQLPMSPAGGMFTRFSVRSGLAAGIGESYTYTVRKNGIDTTITATIAGATATQASDFAHSFNWTTNDLISIHVVATGGAAATTHAATLS